MMMAANLVGFVIGVDGMRYMVEQLFGTAQGWTDPFLIILQGFINSFALFSNYRYIGIQFLFVASVCLFVAVQVMFEYR